MNTSTRRALIAVGCGALLLIVTCGGLAAGGFYLLTRLGHSAPVRDVLAHAESDPRVISLLGRPLESGFPQHVTLAYGSEGARIEVDMDVRGPLGEGYVSAAGTREDDLDPWTWHRFLVAVGEERIDLSSVAPPREVRDAAPVVEPAPVRDVAPPGDPEAAPVPVPDAGGL